MSKLSRVKKSRKIGINQWFTTNYELEVAAVANENQQPIQNKNRKWYIVQTLRWLITYYSYGYLRCLTLDMEMEWMGYVGEQIVEINELISYLDQQKKNNLQFTHIHTATHTIPVGTPLYWYSSVSRASTVKCNIFMFTSDLIIQLTH